jgi:hypothetical protein
MTVLSTLQRDCRETEYAEKAIARLGVQPAIDFYGSPEMDKEESNSTSNSWHNQKATDQHRVFDVPLHPKTPGTKRHMKFVSRHLNLAHQNCGVV